MGKWSAVVTKETIEKAKLARNLKKNGASVSEIAKKLELSKSRIYEYLRGESGQNWQSKNK